MKKAILFLLGLILLSAITNAQSSFGEGSRVFSAGVGLWSGYYRHYSGWGTGYRNSPAVILAYEQALSKRLGPGYLGAGAVLSWQTSNYRNNDYYIYNQRYYYNYRYTNYVLAAKLAYHWDELVSEDLDIYAGITAGLRFQTYKYSTNYTGIDAPGYTDTKSTTVYPVGGINVGLRWYFQPRIALMAEVNYASGLPYITAGLAFKL